MLERIKNYFQKRKVLAAWKAEKRKKWLALGREPEYIEKVLKLHKVKF